MHATIERASHSAEIFLRRVWVTIASVTKKEGRAYSVRTILLWHRKTSDDAWDIEPTTDGLNNAVEQIANQINIPNVAASDRAQRHTKQRSKPKVTVNEVTTQSTKSTKIRKLSIRAKRLRWTVINSSGSALKNNQKNSWTTRQRQWLWWQPCELWIGGFWFVYSFASQHHLLHLLLVKWVYMEIAKPKKCIKSTIRTEPGTRCDTGGRHD